MTKVELAAGLEFLFEQNAGQDEVSIQWFGGEPTIRFDARSEPWQQPAVRAACSESTSTWPNKEQARPCSRSC